MVGARCTAAPAVVMTMYVRNFMSVFLMSKGL